MRNIAEKKYEMNVKIQNTLNKSLDAAVQDAGKNIDQLERKIEIAVKEAEETAGQKREKAIKTLGKASDQFFSTVAAGSSIAIGKTTDFLKESVTAGLGFEAQMSSVKTITKASSSEMERLDSVARKMGETTGFSAQEAGKELERLALA
ncbi:MAG: phage tail tape measure protein [Paenibacillaceae bacterium]|nr:phage tail tape measure protein [Paenibacillaceae bacterium]